MDIRLIPILLLVPILSACSRPPEPLQIPDNPSDPVTLVVPPVSSTISSTILPADVATKNIGTPVPGWENIPIMPGAHDPELEDIVYLYTVDAPVDQVEEYYQSKMEVNGWTLTNRQVVEATDTEGPSTVLDYQKKDQSLDVMLVNHVDQKATTVILSKLSP